MVEEFCFYVRSSLFARTSAGWISARPTQLNSGDASHVCNIPAGHAAVAACVDKLVGDGLLTKQTRGNRLPPLFTPTSLDKIGSDDYVVLRPLRTYEQNALEQAINHEYQFAADQSYDP